MTNEEADKALKDFRVATNTGRLSMFWELLKWALGAEDTITELRAKLTSYETTDYARKIAASEKLAERMELFKSLSCLWDGDDEAALNEWNAANKGECQHERGIITNHKSYPATLEEPSEETGTVTCSECGECWELGYEPSGMDLEIER